MTHRLPPAPQASALRLLCINPNTTQAMTDKVVAALRDHLPERAEVVAETGRFGAPFISTRTSFAIGAHAAIEAFARRADEPWDAVLLVCFGDPALHALRELADVPVFGMALAAMTLAARRHGRFSVVTGGVQWDAMLREFAASVGYSDQLVSVRTTTATGGDIFLDPAGTRAALVQTITDCEADGADCVILGGAGLAGMAEGLKSCTSLPLIDSVEALASLAVETVAANRRQGIGARPSPLALQMMADGWLHR